MVQLLSFLGVMRRDSRNSFARCAWIKSVTAITRAAEEHPVTDSDDGRAYTYPKVASPRFRKMQHYILLRFGPAFILGADGRPFDRTGVVRFTATPRRLVQRPAALFEPTILG